MTTSRQHARRVRAYHWFGKKIDERLPAEPDQVGYLATGVRLPAAKALLFRKKDRR
jgi:hypothetical protein